MSLFPMFLLVFSLIILIFSTYIGLRLIPRSRLSPPLRMVAWIMVYFPLSFAPVRFLVSKVDGSQPYADIALWFIYFGLGLFSFVLVFLLLHDVVWLSAYLTGKIARRIKRSAGQSKKNEMIDPTRRAFMTNSVNAGIVTLSGGFTAYGGYKALRVPEVKQVAVGIDNLPPAFEGYSIVQLTDLHINKPREKGWLQEVVAQTNRCAADAIVVTGDLSDSPAERVHNEITPLAELTAPDGCFFVTGNHEYYAGVSGWLVAVKRLGFTVLLNEHQVIRRGRSRLLMAGVPDISAERHFALHHSSPQKALVGYQPGDVKILLAHQPQSIYAASEAGFDLQLSGHTHGGQFVPWKYIAGLVQPYLYGLHRVGKTQLYVSRGTGYWGPPVRIGAPSEITLISLIGAPAEQQEG